MAVLHCVLTSPEGTIFQTDARSVVVPAVDGELGILPRHAPLIGLLGSGELRIEPASGKAGGKEAGKVHYFLQGGFVEVLDDQVTILATQVESLETLTRDEADARVKSLLAERPDSRQSFEVRDEHAEKVRVARRKAKLSRG